MAKLKDPSQRLKTNRYNELIDKHENIIKEARRKQVKFKDDAKRCERYEKQIEKAKQMEDYYWFKQNDPVSICEDYEIEAHIDTDMIEFHLRNLFQNDNAYVSIMLKDEKVRRRMLAVKSLRIKAPHLLSLNMNSYLSNVDYAHQRTIKDKDGEDIVLKGAYKELVIKIYAITIDLDYRNSIYAGMAAEDLYEVMKDDGTFDDIGEPSYCIVSSEYSGMQLIYLLDKPYDTYFKTNRITKFEDTIKNMVEIFKDYASDPVCVDIGHLFRLPTSYNSKTHSYSFILNWNEIRDDDYEVARYSFEELEQRAKTALGLPIEPPQPVKPATTAKLKRKQQTQKANQSTMENNIKTLTLKRCKDLKRLIELRGNEMNGYRNSLLYIYGSLLNGLCIEKDIIIKELHLINSMFISPLSKKEVNRIGNSISKKLYKFTDKFICDTLTVTETEKRALQAIGHNLTKEEIKERNRERQRLLRLKKGHVPKETRAGRNVEIRKLHEDGLTTKQLAELFNLSIRSVQRIIKGTPQSA